MKKYKQLVENPGPFYTVQEKPFDIAAEVFEKGGFTSAKEFKEKCIERWKEVLKQYGPTEKSPQEKLVKALRDLVVSSESYLRRGDDYYGEVATDIEEARKLIDQYGEKD